MKVLEDLERARGPSEGAPATFALSVISQLLDGALGPAAPPAAAAAQTHSGPALAALTRSNLEVVSALLPFLGPAAVWVRRRARPRW